MPRREGRIRLSPAWTECSNAARTLVGEFVVAAVPSTLDMSTPPIEATASVDVAVGGSPIAAWAMTPGLLVDDSLSQVTLQFEVPTTAMDTEFRVWTAGLTEVSARLHVEVEEATGEQPTTLVEKISETEQMPEPAQVSVALAEERSMQPSIRRAARPFLWPVRRFFDPRFRGIAEQIDEKSAHLAALIDATREESVGLSEVRPSLADLTSLTNAQADAHMEMAALIGESLASLREAAEASIEDLRELRASSGQQSDILHELRATLALGEGGEAELLSQLKRLAEETRDLDRLTGATVDDIDAPVGRFLTYAEGHLGFAAQAGLWFNPPVTLAYEPGEVVVSGVTERIAEVPYVIRALSHLASGSTVLDIGAAESTLSTSLATLGFFVTAIDIRPYPLQHPRLRVVTCPIETWRHDGTFDAVVCLSTLEHLGRGAYGDSRADERTDLAAMHRVKELTRPGSLLVATVPYGHADEGDLDRTYDRAGLDELLNGWLIDELSFLTRQSPTVWTLSSDADGQQETVALITAHRPE